MEYLQESFRNGRSDAIFHLGNAFSMQNKVAAAKTCYEISFNQFGNVSVLINMVRMYIKNNMNDKAINYLKLGVALTDESCLIAMGDLYLSGDLGMDVDFERASIFYQIAADNFESAEVYAKLATTKYQLDLADQAIHYFKKSLKIENNPDVLLSFGAVYVGLKNWKEAVECFHQAL